MSILLAISAPTWGCAGAPAGPRPEALARRGPPPHVTVLATEHFALRASLFLAFAARLTGESRAPDEAPKGRVAAARAWARARTAHLAEARRALADVAECETRDCADRALGPLVGHDALAAALADYRAHEWPSDARVMRRTMSQVDLATDEAWVALMARGRRALAVEGADARVVVDVVAVESYLDDRDVIAIALSPASPCARATEAPPSEEDHARLTGCALALALAREQAASAFATLEPRRWQLLVAVAAAVVSQARTRRAQSPWLTRAGRLEPVALERVLERWPMRMRGAPPEALREAFDEP